MEEFGLTILRWLLLWFVVFPLVTLVHELGHLIPTLTLSSSGSLLRIGGPGPRLIGGRTARVQWEWRPLVPFMGHAYPDGPMPRRAGLAMLCGGIVLELVLVVGLLMVRLGIGDTWLADNVLEPAIILGAIGIITSVIPLTFPDVDPKGELVRSDGYWIREVLRHPEWDTLTAPGLREGASGAPSP